MVNPYEVEVAYTQNGKTGLTVRTEYAYSVQDAIMQALFNQGAQGASDIVVKRVGPPMEQIRLAATRLSSEIAAVTDAIRGKVEKPDPTVQAPPNITLKSRY